MFSYRDEMCTFLFERWFRLSLLRGPLGAFYCERVGYYVVVLKDGSFKVVAWRSPTESVAVWGVRGAIWPSVRESVKITFAGASITYIDFRRRCVTYVGL